MNDDRRSIEDAYSRRFGVGSARLSKLLQLPVEAHASGASVWDSDDAEYLDLGGFGVFLLGHRHPAIVSAVERQLHTMPLSTRFFLNAGLASAADELVAVSPPGLERVAFVNSGAEAVELGLKIAHAAGARRIVSASGGFHGKTIGALAVTGRERFRQPFAGLLLEVDFVPFGDAAAVERLLRRERAVVILEPILGEGGVVVPPPEYLAEVRAACDRNGALLLIDEIQTGMGRTGSWWASQAAPATPDIMLAGKSLGGGVMPVGAVLCTPDAFGAFERDPLLHSSTFGGNPLATASVRAAIAATGSDGLLRRVATTGAALLSALREVAITGPSAIVDVRGAGLLLGVEFAEEYLAAAFLSALLDRRVIASYSLGAERVVRLTPPVVLTDSQLRQAISALTDAADEVNSTYM